MEIKVELELYNKRNIVSYYRFKNYLFDLEKNKLNQRDALKLANKFVNDYVDKEICHSSRLRTWFCRAF